MNNSIKDIFLDDEGKLLYHYTSMSIAFDHILKDGKLRISPMRLLDDPKESKDWFWKIYNSGIGQESLIDDANNYLNNNYYVLCFSQDSKGADCSDLINLKKNIYKKGFAKSRMWSQYADKHKGICLAFSRKQVLSDIKTSFGSNPIYRGAVKYSNPSIKSLASQGLDVPDIEGCIKKHKNEIFFNKNIDYRDESEYRFVFNSDKNDYEFVDINNSLRGIILGVDVKEHYRSVAKNFALKYKVKQRTINWNNGRPHLP